MLRRKPTLITLTSEDVTAYAEHQARVRSLHLQENHPDSTSTSAFAAKDGNGVIDPNDELKPLPGDKARIVRSGLGRDERIGVVGR